MTWVISLRMIHLHVLVDRSCCSFASNFAHLASSAFRLFISSSICKLIWLISFAVEDWLHSTVSYICGDWCIFCPLIKKTFCIWSLSPSFIFCSRSAMICVKVRFPSEPECIVSITVLYSAYIEMSDAPILAVLPCFFRRCRDLFGDVLGEPGLVSEGYAAANPWNSDNGAWDSGISAFNNSELGGSARRPLCRTTSEPDDVWADLCRCCCCCCISCNALASDSLRYAGCPPRGLNMTVVKDSIWDSDENQSGKEGGWSQSRAALAIPTALFRALFTRAVAFWAAAPGGAAAGPSEVDPPALSFFLLLRVVSGYGIRTEKDASVFAWKWRPGVRRKVLTNPSLSTELHSAGHSLSPQFSGFSNPDIRPCIAGL